MRRSLKTIDQGDTTLYRILIESDDCLWGTQESRFIQFELLRYLAEDPAFSACGPSDFRKMTMLHDGSRWLMEMEASVGKTP